MTIKEAYADSVWGEAGKGTKVNCSQKWLKDLD